MPSREWQRQADGGQSHVRGRGHARLASTLTSYGRGGAAPSGPGPAAAAPGQEDAGTSCRIGRNGSVTELT